MPIKLNSTGGGSVTIDVPNTGSNFTLTAPANTATLITSATVGTIIQVVSNTTIIGVTGSSTSYVDTTLSATITPRSSTNKILVLVNQFHTVARNGATAYAGIKLVRGSTDILLPVSDGTGPYEFGISATGATATQLYGRHTITYLDSPATTSSTTYKTQVRSYNGAETYYCQSAPGSTINGTSTITLMEVIS